MSDAARKTPPKPFPPLLWAALLLGVPLCLLAYVPGLSMFAIAGAIIDLAAVPVAIGFLLRGGYRSAANIAVTAFAATPIVLTLVAAFIFFFGHWHM